MKPFFMFIVIVSSLSLTAQKPCEYATNVTDSIGVYKSTKNYLMYERNFGGTESYLYFSLALTDGLPTLNTQFLKKSKDFIKADCFDRNSRIYLQLENGKIVTLLHIDSQDCGTGVRNEGINNRVLSGFFLFPKESIEELKKSPVYLIRIKYTTETQDYIMKSELKSELDGQTYNASQYFIDTLPCLD